MDSGFRQNDEVQTIKPYICYISFMNMDSFEWDIGKDLVNQAKHGVSFAEAQNAFADTNRVVAVDLTHGGAEEQYYCYGKVEQGILTVRFTYRRGMIRIIGAGYWRKGKQIYERENKIY